MLGQLRNSIFTKVLFGLMGIYLLNISVDTADPYPDYIPEDLSYNDQESIVEIIIEKVLGFENAIEEYDDRDSEDHNKKKNVKIDFLVYESNKTESIIKYLKNKKQLFIRSKDQLTSGFKEIDSPPPKLDLFS
jgi:hypothetical protein